MSQGSTVVPVRFPDELLAKLGEAIWRINLNRREEPYTPSSFIRRCVTVELAHLERARKKGSVEKE